MTPTTPEETTALEALREFRNQALSATDHTQLADSALSDADKASYASYRQYLRDLPENATTEEVMSFTGVQTFEEWSAA